MHPRTTAISNLLRLPDELLDLIVTETIPEGFESLTLTCKRLFAICEPSIKRHNELDRRYRTFSYGLLDPSFPFPILTAFHLIARIITEPTVARYIRHADFKLDSRAFFVHGQRYDSAIEEIHLESLVSFVAKSPILTSIGLDGHAAAHEIEEDVDNRRYSQHAAAFLLTMLPNVESLTLPAVWEPDELSSALLATAVRSAVAHDGTRDIDCGLGKITTLRNSTPSTPQGLFEMEWATPFLCLPHIRSLHGNSFVKSVSCETIAPHGMLLAGIAAGLRTLRLTHCCLHLDSLCSLLRSATNLRSLCYSHAVKNGMPLEWALTDFLTAIAEITGNHLEELSVLRGKDVQVQRSGGLTIASQFLHLRLLELPLDIFGQTHPGTDLYCDAPVVKFTNVISSSVIKLAFSGQPGLWDAGQGLETFFNGFAEKKQILLPKLQELHIACPDNSNDGYKSRCMDLQADCKETGVEARLHRFAFLLI